MAGTNYPGVTNGSAGYQSWLGGQDAYPAMANWGMDAPAAVPAFNTPVELPAFQAGATAPGSSLFSGFFGSTAADGTKTQGWGGTALGVAQGLGNAYLGMKQYGLAKDTLAENKRQFALNFGAQQKTTNAHLMDRQNARVASNPGAYQSVGDYMAKNGI
jgi:hypothetical protein